MLSCAALSGSGPAYMYIFLEALADGAVACGIPRAKAYEYAAMTMAGSAQMFQLCSQLISYHLLVANVGFLFCKRAKLIDKHCSLLTYSLRALG